MMFKHDAGERTFNTSNTSNTLARWGEAGTASMTSHCPPGHGWAHEHLVIINTISVSQVVAVVVAPLVTTSNYLLSGNVSLQANVPLFSPAGSCFLSWMWEKVYFSHLFISWVWHSKRFFFFLSRCLSYFRILTKISRCVRSLARVIFGGSVSITQQATSGRGTSGNCHDSILI